MHKKNVYFVIGIALLGASLWVSTSAGADVRTLAAAALQAFGFGSSTSAVSAMSSAALSANGLTEVLPAEYVQITHNEGKSKNTKRLVTSLPDGTRHEIEVNEDAIVSLITPIQGGHLYVPSRGSSKMQVKTSAQKGYDQQGISNAVSAKVEKGGTTDVIIT